MIGWNVTPSHTLLYLLPKVKRYHRCYLENVHNIANSIKETISCQLNLNVLLLLEWDFYQRRTGGQTCYQSYHTQTHNMAPTIFAPILHICTPGHFSYEPIPCIRNILIPRELIDHKCDQLLFMLTTALLAVHAPCWGRDSSLFLYPLKIISHQFHVYPLSLLRPPSSLPPAKQRKILLYSSNDLVVF